MNPKPNETVAPTLSGKDFAFLYETWRRITSPYTSNEEMERLFKLEVRIWEIVHRRYRTRNSGRKRVGRHQDVAFSNEDFQLLYGALRELAKPYTHDDVANLVRLEDKIWGMLQRIAITNGIEMIENRDYATS